MSVQKSNDKKHLGHRTRLRQRFLNNPADLPDYELLELLLGYALLRKDTKPLAKDLLDRFKHLKNVFEAQEAELKEIDGFGPGLQTFWNILRECNARQAELSPCTKIVMDNPHKIVKMARQRFAGYKHEELWAAFVDNQNRLMAWRAVSKGSGSQVFISNNDVLRMALEYHATGIILVHNHPGGNTMPSPADIDLTLNLARAAKHIGVRVLDHIIVTDESYLSMSDNKMMQF